MKSLTIHDDIASALRSRDLAKLVSLLALKPALNTPESAYCDLPLQEAVADGFITGMELLLRAGADVNCRGRYNTTPLMTAAQRGQVEAGLWLLHHGADVHAVNSHVQNTLSFAVATGNLSFADMLLQKVPALKEDLTALASRIISRRELRTAEWLLKQGVSPDLKNDQGHPWLLAVQSASQAAEYLALTELLIAHGANVNQQNAEGETALRAAAGVCALPSFMRLLQAGADPDIVDLQGKSVRELLELPELVELKNALQAWEASCAAQRILQGTACPSRPDPL